METPIKAIKKPIKIEALQWTGANEVFVRAFINDDSLIHMTGTSNMEVYNTEEKDWMNVPVDHYIIKGIKGELYACSPEVFARTYDVIPEV